MQELIEKLQASVTDPEKKLLAAAIASDLVRISALAITDPSRAAELGAALKAQTSGLAATEASNWAGIVTNWMQRAIHSALAGALA